MPNHGQPQTHSGSGLVAWVLAASMMALFAGCLADSRPGSEQRVTRRPIEDVLRDHTAEIMSLRGVVGLYQGELEDGSPCIKIMVVAARPELTARIPKSLEGYPVRVDVTGEIRPLPSGER